jgi:hypothetical protein
MTFVIVKAMMNTTRQKENIFTSDYCRTIRAKLETSERDAELGREALAHFEHCQSCRLYERQLAGLRTLLASQPRVAPPADFDITLRRRISEAREERQKPFWSTLTWQPAGAVAAAMLVIGLAATLTLTRFVQKPGHMALTPAAVTPVAESTPSSVPASTPESATDDADKSGIEATIASAGDGERSDTASRRVVNAGERNIRNVFSASRRNPRAEYSDDIVVMVHDGANRSHSVRIDMVTYGSQPVMNLGTLVSPDDIDRSLSSDDDSKIF